MTDKKNCPTDNTFSALTALLKEGQMGSYGKKRLEASTSPAIIEAASAPVVERPRVETRQKLEADLVPIKSTTLPSEFQSIDGGADLMSVDRFQQVELPPDMKILRYGDNQSFRDLAERHMSEGEKVEISATHIFEYVKRQIQEYLMEAELVVGAPFFRDMITGLLTRLSAANVPSEAFEYCLVSLALLETEPNGVTAVIDRLGQQFKVEESVITAAKQRAVAVCSDPSSTPQGEYSLDRNKVRGSEKYYRAVWFASRVLGDVALTEDYSQMKSHMVMSLPAMRAIAAAVFSNPELAKQLGLWSSFKVLLAGKPDQLDLIHFFNNPDVFASDTSLKTELKEYAAKNGYPRMNSKGIGLGVGIAGTGETAYFGAVSDITDEYMARVAYPSAEEIMDIVNPHRVYAKYLSRLQAMRGETGLSMANEAMLATLEANPATPFAKRFALAHSIGTSASELVVLHGREAVTAARGGISAQPMLRIDPAVTEPMLNRIKEAANKGHALLQAMTEGTSISPKRIMNIQQIGEALDALANIITNYGGKTSYSKVDPFRGELAPLQGVFGTKDTAAIAALYHAANPQVMYLSAAVIPAEYKTNDDYVGVMQVPAWQVFKRPVSKQDLWNSLEAGKQQPPMDLKPLVINPSKSEPYIPQQSPDEDFYRYI